MDKPGHIDRTRTHDLTISDKACPEFAHCTDEQAKEIIETLKIFTKIVFDYYQKSGKKIEK